LAFLDLKAACLEFKYAGKQRNRAIAGKEPMKTAVVGLVHSFVKTFTAAAGVLGWEHGRKIQKLPALVLSAEEEQRLITLGASRAAPLREVERARILLYYQRGNNPSAIQRALNISRVTIYPLPA